MFAASLLLASGVSAFAQGNMQGDSDLYVPGELYVQFKPGVLNLPKSADRHVPVSALFPAAKSYANPYGLQPKAFSLRMGSNVALANTFRIAIDSLSKMEDFIKELQKDSRIEYLERVPLQKIQVISSPARLRKDAAGEGMPKSDSTATGPNDTYFGEVGGIQTSWHLEMVGYNELYGKYKASPDIRVAIIDNAVWGGHPDLQLDSANMYDAAHETVGSSFPPFYVGQNQPGTPPDRFSSAYHWSHGTHCAGLVGAITDNEEGIASVGSGLTLVGVKGSLDADGESLPRAVEGAIWAADQGVDVISMSYGNETNSRVEGNIYTSMVRQGIILLGAAGNSGKADVPSYPADYEGVISVGSLDSDGLISYFSNTGTWVDVWTPGGYWVVDGHDKEDNLILSTTYGVTNYYSSKPEFAGTYYDAMAGTSMATPLTSGIVGLILSYYPDLNAYQMRDLLRRTSREGCTYVPAALEYLENLDGRQVNNLEARCNPSTGKVAVSWQSPEDASAESYRVYLNGETVGETSNLYYEWTLTDSTIVTDTAGEVGVAAIYAGTAELPVYARFTIDNHLSNEAASIRPEQIRVRVDHVAKTVQLPQGFDFERIEVYNIQGALMLSAPAGTLTLDMSGCADGMYIGRAFRDGLAVPFKFVL